MAGVLTSERGQRDGHIVGLVRTVAEAEAPTFASCVRAALSGRVHHLTGSTWWPRQPDDGSRLKGEAADTTVAVLLAALLVLAAAALLMLAAAAAAAAAARPLVAAVAADPSGAQSVSPRLGVA